MGFQKSLLTGMGKSAMVGSSAGHTPHAKQSETPSPSGFCCSARLSASNTILFDLMSITMDVPVAGLQRQPATTTQKTACPIPTLDFIAENLTSPGLPKFCEIMCPILVLTRLQPALNPKQPSQGASLWLGAKGVRVPRGFLQRNKPGMLSAKCDECLASRLGHIRNALR
jgi:hypothetical protein